MKKSKGKGILLYSGGLDSLLAAKVLMNQGLEIIGFHCLLPFVDPYIDPETLKISERARSIGLPLKFYRCDEEYLDMVKNPPHGYGKNVNPCIDCKIFFINKAVKIMEEEGADFIATGEVVGQRPMSQLKHTINRIAKEVDLQGLLLRPLSAKLLKPTIVEENGIVDREKLLSLNGRSRKPQFELAKEFGIDDYSSPGGGCLFTEPNSAIKIKDLMKYAPDFTPLDIYLLSHGRNFRPGENTKIIVARNEADYNILEKSMKYADYFFIPQFKGPVVFGKGDFSPEEIELTGSIIRRYGKVDINNSKIDIYQKGNLIKSITASVSIAEDELNKIRI